MTKEEILDKHHNLNLGMLSITEKQIQAAMDDYAKQEAIAFAEWVIKSNYDFNGKTGMWYNFISTPEIDLPEKPTEQLYSLFLEQKK